MPALLHLSDPHFGTERAQVVEALLDCITGLHDVRFTVISGDITQRARTGQFRRARVFVDRLRAQTGRPVLVLPGNHDIPLFDLAHRLLTPFANYRATFGDDSAQVHEDDGIHIQLVNTVGRWLHTDGIARAADVARVAQRLAAARPGQLRVVVTHQPAAVARAADAPHLLRGHTRALRIWARAGADLVLGGHIHLPYVQRVTPDGADGRWLWVIQAGTAVSRRIRHEAGNAFNVIRYGEPGPVQCVVEAWHYVEHQDRFVCRTCTPLDLDPARIGG